MKTCKGFVSVLAVAVATLALPGLSQAGLIGLDTADRYVVLGRQNTTIHNSEEQTQRQ